MTPQKRKELNDRKTRAKRFKEWWAQIGTHKEESKPSRLSDAETAKRIEAYRIFHMDEPRPESGFDMWNSNPEPKPEGLNSENWGKDANESLEKQLEKETKRLTKT